MTPSRELALAADIIEESAAAVFNRTWRYLPWDAEECMEEDGSPGCPCIVFQGVYDDTSVDPPMATRPIQYIADAESAEYADWITLMHPQNAGPLVAMLRARSHRLAIIANPQQQQLRADGDFLVDFARGIIAAHKLRQERKEAQDAE